MGPVGFDVEQQAVIWAMWRRGEAIRELERTLGETLPRIRRYLRESGGIPPIPRRRRFGHLSLDEREEISGGGGKYEFVWGTYPLGSSSAIGEDLAMLGRYAEGNDGIEQVIFAEFMQENHAGLTPLVKFGFALHAGRMSACYGQYSHTPVECPENGVGPTNPSEPPPVAAPGPSITNPILTITNPVPAPTAPPPPSQNSPQIPTDADRQGFLGYPGARCNYVNPAVVIARTADSALVICQTGVGRYYYRGVGLKNGLSVEIDDPVRTGAGFVATNNGVQYSVSPGALVITQGSSLLSNEPMLEYWSA